MANPPKYSYSPTYKSDTMNNFFESSARYHNEMAEVMMYQRQLDNLPDTDENKDQKKRLQSGLAKAKVKAKAAFKKVTDVYKELGKEFVTAKSEVDALKHA